MKPIEFVGSSQEDLRNFPAEARRAAGFELNFVQIGLLPQKTRQADIALAQQRFKEIGGKP